MFVKKLFCVSFCILLGGCLLDDWQPTDFASSDKDKYLASKNGKDLLVPPPLTNSNLSDFYVLPEQKQNAKVGIEPPGVE